jgi:UDP-glucose 4-epimerase
MTVFGDGLQTRDFIYVGDIARANVAALRGDVSGVCNVATGETVTLLQLIDALAAVAGARPQVSFAPARTGDIRDSAADNARLRRELGVERFTSLRDGLAQLWASGG